MDNSPKSIENLKKVFMRLLGRHLGLMTQEEIIPNHVTQGLIVSLGKDAGMSETEIGEIVNMVFERLSQAHSNAIAGAFQIFSE